MGTKNNPGRFDCYQNAKPDEPMFVLLGRDKHAAGLVRLWALLRHAAGEDEAIVHEALQCAGAMDAWAFMLGKLPGYNEEPFWPLFEALTRGIAEHPEGFESPCMCDLCQSCE